MIYTVTLNPAIDYFIKLDNVKLGEINKFEEYDFFPGGKGINVSRILSNLNFDNISFGFTGGFSGNYIKESLKKQKIKFNFVEIEGINRINIKLKSNVETEINGSGIFITKNNLNELIKKMKKYIKKDDFLILSGSVPKSDIENIYGKIMESFKEANIILDTTGVNLLKNLKYKPFLIKPNEKELEELFDIEMKSDQNIIQYAKKLNEKGALNVLVSRGEKGAIFISKDKKIKAIVPNCIVKNAVGAGDSMVGGFIAKYSEEQNIKEALKFSCACGTASASCVDLAKKRDVENLLKKIEIKEID